jgi:hypothetical protein
MTPWTVVRLNCRNLRFKLRLVLILSAADCNVARITVLRRRKLKYRMLAARIQLPRSGLRSNFAMIQAQSDPASTNANQVSSVIPLLSPTRCNHFLPFLEHKVPGGTLPLVSVPSARSPGVFTPADSSPVF